MSDTANHKSNVIGTVSLKQLYQTVFSTLVYHIVSTVPLFDVV